MGSQSLLLPSAVTALLLSLGLNAYLALRGEPAATALPAPAASAPPPPPDNNAALRAELERCHRENWSVALRAMTPAPPAASNSAAVAGPSAPQAHAGPAVKTGAAEQDDALTQMAREQVRLQWKMGRGAIVPFLLHELEDPSKREGWVRQEAEAMATSANLNATQKERIERDYAPIRAANAAALKEALTQQPPDIAAAVTATKSLYSAEDALLSRVAGDEARDRYRAEVMHRRTALVAVFAALGDQPWNQALAW